MPLTLDFSHKLVFITGGGRGIGWAITQSLAKAGADVAVTYTSSDSSSQTEELSKQTGTKVKSFKCEITDSNQVNETLERVEKEYGKKVDIGIACAGISLWKDAHNNTDDDFKRIFDVNTFGAYYFARALSRSWMDFPIPVSSDPSSAKLGQPRKLGKQILFISSISGLVAMYPQRQAAYNASKGALTLLSKVRPQSGTRRRTDEKSLATEWAPWGITVNSISPGYVSTDMIANPPDEEAKAWAKEWENRTPAGRFASAEEIGDCVALLVSEKQGGMGWMTGSDVVVDGGKWLNCRTLAKR